ncbi:3754_t:CDS:2, partial [Scutellospora calospora]
MDWINFFDDNNIEKKNEDKWKFSGLNIQECETAIKNGWVDLLKAIIDKRNTFRYKIDEPNNEFDNDGLDPIKYQKILKSINETKEIVFDKWKNKVTPEFLNKFLGSFLKRKGDENLKEKNLDKWLKGEEVEVGTDKLMGYTLQTEPIKKIRVAEIINGKFTGDINKNIELNGISGADVLIEEEKLSFDPDKLINDKYDPTITDPKDPNSNVDGPGILTILTGGGKTTKLTRCLLTCIFPGKHIILITPNNELAADAANHHTSWLQYTNSVPYKCVIHGKEGKLPYSVKKDSLASWDNGNEIIGYQQRKERGADVNDLTKPIYKKETSGKDGESTLSILQLHHLTRYIACGKTKINEIVT